jgi:hypothetical protein
MKQTAVEWLVAELIEKGLLIANGDTLKLIGKAKQMFEQQITDAYNQGSEAGYELAKNDDFIEGYKTKEAEQYYNETFKNEKQ